MTSKFPHIIMYKMYVLPFVDIKPGHIKGAVSIAFTELIDPDTKQMKSADAIREVFKSVGCDLDQKPVVAMCGSGECYCQCPSLPRLSIDSRAEGILNDLAM